MPTHYQGPRDQALALDLFIKLARAADSVGARLQTTTTQEEISATMPSTCPPRRAVIDGPAPFGTMKIGAVPPGPDRESAVSVGASM